MIVSGINRLTQVTASFQRADSDVSVPEHKLLLLSAGWLSPRKPAGTCVGNSTSVQLNLPKRNFLSSLPFYLVAAFSSTSTAPLVYLL